MSLNEYVTKRCVELEKENNELKKEFQKYNKVPKRKHFQAIK